MGKTDGKNEKGEHMEGHIIKF